MDEVKEARDEVLLTTFAALTHRLHVADRKKEPGAAEHALEIRRQRNEVESEILTRMANGRDAERQLRHELGRP